MGSEENTKPDLSQRESLWRLYFLRERNASSLGMCIMHARLTAVAAERLQMGARQSMEPVETTQRQKGLAKREKSCPGDTGSSLLWSDAWPSSSSNSSVIWAKLLLKPLRFRFSVTYNPEFPEIYIPCLANIIPCYNGLSIGLSAAWDLKVCEDRSGSYFPLYLQLPT